MVIKRVVIIGLGAQLITDHLPALRLMSSVEVLGVMDQDSSKSLQLAKQLNVLQFSSVEEVV